MPIKIGPSLEVFEPNWVPNMQDAYAADNERGSHHLNNIAADQIAREWPTVCEMAATIETQRDAMIAQLVSLKNEVNCRIEYGAKGKEHLQYIEEQLNKIIKANEYNQE